MPIKYIYTIQGFYRNQWQDVTTETNRQDALQRLKEYEENQPQYIHRLIKQTAMRNLIFGTRTI
jgi:hypothetical protein